MMSSMLNPVLFGVAAADAAGCVGGCCCCCGGGGDTSGGDPISCVKLPFTDVAELELAPSGDTIGGNISSSGGFNRGWFLCRPYIPIVRESDGKYGSPSGPIGLFRSGIELKKFGVRWSIKALVTVAEVGRLDAPTLWCKSRRTCNIGINISARPANDCMWAEFKESWDCEMYCDDAKLLAPTGVGDLCRGSRS